MKGKTKAGSIDSLKEQLRDEAPRPTIPSKILADLIKGNKVRCYGKNGGCCGILFWDGEKLRFSAYSDLK